MTRNLHVDAVALAEFEEATLYVEDQDSGLGDELTDAVAEVFAKITERPESFPVVRRAHGHEARSALVTRFRFRVVFVMRPRSIWVISIARQARRPLYWVSRLRKSPPP